MKKAGDCLTFGDRLTYARNKKGLNQRQLAALIGVIPHRLSRWETGNHSPDASMIQKIVKALEVSEDWLMGNDDNFSVKNSTENSQDIKLTKEQQQLVIDNQIVIGAVFKNFVRTYKPMVIYDDFYGDAAIALCRAAKIYSENGDHTAAFFTFAYDFVNWAVFNSYRKTETYLNRTTSLNNKIDHDGDVVELGSLIPAPDNDFEQLEYKVLVESVYQKVEPVLTAKEKEAFRFWLHGISRNEIAKSLGVTETAVMNRTKKARAKCRNCFNPDELFT